MSHTRVFSDFVEGKGPSRCSLQPEQKRCQRFIGPRALHYMIGPKVTRITVGIPGSGLSWTEYTPNSSQKTD